jgi:hypothetical protein
MRLGVHCLLSLRDSLTSDYAVLSSNEPVRNGLLRGYAPQPSLFQMADGGTLFLDEIGDNQEAHRSDSR